MMRVFDKREVSETEESADTPIVIRMNSATLPKIPVINNLRACYGARLPDFKMPLNLIKMAFFMRPDVAAAVA
jgi:hypothetical protein